MSDAPATIATTPAQIRKAGLINAGVGLGGIVFGRVLVEIMIAMEMGSPMIGGAMAVLFPVIGAFGLTSVITGRDRGGIRIPLVVILSILLIGLAFYVIIPSGYRLSSAR